MFKGTSPKKDFALPTILLKTQGHEVNTVSLAGGSWLYQVAERTL